MPFTLPANSRRKFLRGSLAAFAGALITKQSAFSKEAADPTSWLLFSDAHIAADRALVSRSVNVAANLALCVNEALAAHPAASAAIISGDCALLNGQKEDYKTFGELVQPLRDAGLPVHLLMGNHDDRAHFAEALGGINAPSPVEHRIAGVIESKLANWFLLDSLDVTNKTPGLLGPEQRAWLEKALDARADKPALIVVHHNIIPLPENPELREVAKATLSKGGLTDSEDLLAILRPRQQVKACIFGHTHNWSVLRESGGIHLINLPPTGYVFKNGMPSGWVHAALSEHGATLKLNCTDVAHTQHGAKAELTWR